MKHYNVIEYPDGQINVEILQWKPIFTFRIESYKDLFILKSIVETYRFNSADIKKVIIPCLFGQRSDRRFNNHDSFGLKVITDFINSMNIPIVEIFDTHSDVSLALVNNSSKKSPSEIIAQVIAFHDNLVLVSPDAGAYKKVFSIAEKVNLPLVAANKFRDLEGKITLNILGDVKGKNCLIIDDLLDGGYTFHLLAKQLKEQGASKVYLYISHAYFNKGVDFTEYIDHFYCTDSVKEINHEKVTQFKI
jgi:ribose-phosphate pyrophosphokinase